MMRMPLQRLRPWIRRPFRVAVLLVGFAVLLAGLLSAAQTHAFMQKALPATGRVADFEQVSRRSWYPVVEFEDGQGHVVRFTSTMGSRYPSQDIGDDAPVLYDPGDNSPTRAARVAGGPTWGPAIMTVAIGLFLMGTPLWGMRRARFERRGRGYGAANRR